jgi:predicted metal-dependent HD superfamily phosphohydrolase
MPLQQTFLQLVTSYSSQHLANKLWEEIEKAYAHKNRHYHNLSHLANLLTQLNAVKAEIEDWDTILFTLFYHDMIYKAVSSDNEANSAELAEKRMREINVPLDKIENCKVQILATKGHQVSASADTNYFTDADLSILGADWEVYHQYAKNVRKEYAIYPDLIYNPGRKKVLQHFSEMKRLYKTEYFYNKFEEQARLNLEQELKIYK